jgi:hypothetical protein
MVDAQNPLESVELFDFGRTSASNEASLRPCPKRARELYQRFKEWQRSVGAQQMKRNAKYDLQVPTTEESDWGE